VGAVREDIGRSTSAQAPRSAAAIAEALREAREYTLGLYAHLTDVQQRFPRIPTVNPPRWEVGHVGWFQEFWCRRYRSDDRLGALTPSRLRHADEWFDSRFVPHDTRWELPLPDWNGIRAYLAATLDDTLVALDRSEDGARYFFELALYHEDMHAEALLMTLQSLALPAPSCVPSAREARMDEGDVVVRGGTLRMGAARGEDANRFVFDNEKFAHDVDVKSFSIARRCVSEVEFAAFVDAGGYTRPDLWDDAGRGWLATAGRSAPAHWRLTPQGWSVRSFDRWRPLNPERAMQHVNAFEAQAWSSWAGRRLPTEAEWEKAASDGLLPTPGAVWEWTATPFRPYPGFAADPYEEYSAPWFDDHRVLRGGSWATRARLVHPRFRNFYLPYRHDPFAGFRTCAIV
jgi:gamma-glutamyl hercynylcysteine S-oxide synthase